MEFRIYFLTVIQIVEYHYKILISNYAIQKPFLNYMI